MAASEETIFFCKNPGAVLPADAGRPSRSRELTGYVHSEANSAGTEHHGTFVRTAKNDELKNKKAKEDEDKKRKEPEKDDVKADEAMKEKQTKRCGQR